MNKEKILDSHRVHIKCDNCGHEIVTFVVIYSHREK